MHRVVCTRSREGKVEDGGHFGDASTIDGSYEVDLCELACDRVVCTILWRILRAICDYKIDRASDQLAVGDRGEAQVGRWTIYKATGLEFATTAPAKSRLISDV